MTANEIAQILTEQFGGNRWTKYDKDRVYFDAAAVTSQQGMSWNNYRSGNISSATLDGEKISNSEARRSLEGFMFVKLWCDLADGTFYRRGEIDYPRSRDMWKQFVANAKAAINA